MTQKQQVKTRASKKENNIGGIILQMHLYDQITRQLVCLAPYL